MTKGGSVRGQTNYALNAVRAIAALLVAVSHLRTLFFVDYSQSESTSIATQAAYLLASLGHPAVIVFFVLSGYWVGGSVLRGVRNSTFRWSEYAISRMVRLWLVLLPAILLTQILDRAGSSLNPVSDIYKGSDAYHTVIPGEGSAQYLGIVETLGNTLFVQTIHTATLGSNSPLWSLAYEFWYYILFPAAVVALSRNHDRKMRVVAVLIFIAACIIAGPQVLVLFPAWLVGAALAWKRSEVSAWLELLPVPLHSFMTLCVVIGVFGSAAMSVHWHLSPPLTAAVVTLPAGMLIAVFMLDRAGNKAAVMTLQPFSDAAEWSYSLYAVHLPILAFVASFVVPSANDRWQISPLTLTYAALVFVSLCILAHLISMVTERKTFEVRKFILSYFEKVKLKVV